MTARASPRVQGEDASAEAALDAAARVLARARRPFIGGLGTDVAGMRATLVLARRLGAVVDHAGAAAKYRNLHVLQEAGWITTTFAEVKNRADLLVLIGDGWRHRFPRFVERLVAPSESLFADRLVRRIILLDAAAAGAAGALPGDAERLALAVPVAALPCDPRDAERSARRATGRTRAAVGRRAGEARAGDRMAPRRALRRRGLGRRRSRACARRARAAGAVPAGRRAQPVGTLRGTPARRDRRRYHGERGADVAGRHAVPRELRERDDRFRPASLRHAERARPRRSRLPAVDFQPCPRPASARDRGADGRARARRHGARGRACRLPARRDAGHRRAWTPAPQRQGRESAPAAAPGQRPAVRRARDRGAACAARAEPCSSS